MNTATLQKFDLLPPMQLDQSLLDRAWALLQSQRRHGKGPVVFANDRYEFWCQRGGQKDEHLKSLRVKHVQITVFNRASIKGLGRPNPRMNFILFVEDGRVYISLEKEYHFDLDQAKSVTTDEMRRILTQLVTSTRL